MKYLLVLWDGMAQEALPRLGGKTPFEAAHTPYMDALAAAGSRGLLSNCPAPYPVGSDTGILTVLGYDLSRVYTGRAALECADRGIALSPGQTALRVSFLRVTDGILRAVPSENPLVRLLKSGAFPSVPELRFFPQENGQPLAVLEGDPGALVQPHDHVGRPLAAILPEREPLRKIVLASLDILERERLCIWFWGAGKALRLPPFPATGALISATPVCRGIGKLAGLDVPTVPGATGTIDTDYRGKAEAAVAAFETGRDFVAVHIEAPDECSHRLDAGGKVEAIRRIDSLLLPPLLAYLQGCGDSYRILILSDHCTSCQTGRHSRDPVPYILFDSSHRRPAGQSAMSLLFSEDDQGS